MQLKLVIALLLLTASLAHADEEAVTVVGLEVHASSSMTSGDADRISRYFLHNIAKLSPGAAMVVYEGDSRGGGAKADLNVVIYVSKLGKVYSFFVETTDEVALRKELTEKGISRPDVDAVLGDPKSPLTRTSGTSWGTVPESELNENLDEIVKNIVSVVSARRRGSASHRQNTGGTDGISNTQRNASHPLV